MSKKVLLLVLVIALLASVSVVMAQGGGLPGSGWKSGQQVQNIGNASGKIVFTAYGQNGASYACGERTVSAGGSTTYLTDSDCPVPAGFIGSAVVAADQPIAAIVNVNNRGTGAAAGQYQGTDGADVATTIAFPLVKSNHVGRTTTFYAQNASNSPANLNATFKMRDGNTYNWSKSNVPANAMVVISPADAGVPGGNGQVGSLTITSDQPLAGSSLEHPTNVAVADNLQASKAFTPSDYDTTAYCPLYRKNHTNKNQTTGVQVQNVSNAQQTVSMTFTTRDGDVYGPFTETVAAGASATFFAGNIAQIPNGTVGSAVVESSGQIAAVVNDRGVENGMERLTTYACFPSSSATGTINIPLAKEFRGGNTTGIQVQNVGSSPTTVTMTYTNENGTFVIESANPVSPGQSFTAYGVSNNPATVNFVQGNPAQLNNTNNGVVISANQPVVAIANESSTGSGQDTKNYEGFNQ